MNYKGRVDLRLKASVNVCTAIGDSLTPRLGFVISFQPSGINAAILGVDGYVRMQSSSGAPFIGTLKRFSGSTPPHPMCLYPTTDIQEQFVLDLEWRTIHDIERIRDGKEFQLQIELNFLCAELGDQSEIKGITNIRSEVTRNGNYLITITQKEWAEILNRWGIADLRIIEVTMPRDTAYRDRFEAALRHIHDADQRLARGDYDATLVSCRKAFEKVEAQCKEVIDALKDSEDHAIRRSKLVNLHKSLFGLYSVGAHQGAQATRAEAVFGLSMCKEFLAFLSKAEIISRPSVAA